MDAKDLFYSKKLKNNCNKIAKGLADDLFSHVILLMLERETPIIINIERYACSVAYNEFYNKKSLFNKQLGFENIDLTGIEQVEEINNTTVFFDLQQQKIKIAIKKTKRKLPIQDKVFKAYIELKTVRNVAKFYDIPVSTTGRYIKEYKDKLKKQI